MGHLRLMNKVVILIIVVLSLILFTIYLNISTDLRMKNTTWSFENDLERARTFYATSKLSSIKQYL